MDSALDIESGFLAARPRALDLFDERFGGMTGMCRWGWKGGMRDGKGGRGD
jgi:hypothetical protein